MLVYSIKKIVRFFPPEIEFRKNRHLMQAVSLRPVVHRLFGVGVQVGVVVGRIPDHVSIAESGSSSIDAIVVVVAAVLVVVVVAVVVVVEGASCELLRPFVLDGVL
jgi:hypothetical protein